MENSNLYEIFQEKGMIMFASLKGKDYISTQDWTDAEIELAFSTLFGTFGEAFFDRYHEIRPLRPGFFEVRRDLYNLYPLLVHTRLFGGGYAASVERTLARLV